LKLKASKHANEVLRYFLKVLRNKVTPQRLKAGIEIWNRGLGLPAAQLDVEILLKRQISQMTIAELRELEERYLAGAPPPPLIESAAETELSTSPVLKELQPGDSDIIQTSRLFKSN
jgi:hypothetical protein